MWNGFSNLHCRGKKAVSQPKYLTTKEVADLLRIHASVVRASRVSGMLCGYPAPKHIKMGNSKVLYRASEIKWYEDNLVEQRITGI